MKSDLAGESATSILLETKATVTGSILIERDGKQQNIQQTFHKPQEPIQLGSLILNRLNGAVYHLVEYDQNFNYHLKSIQDGHITVCDFTLIKKCCMIVTEIVIEDDQNTNQNSDNSLNETK